MDFSTLTKSFPPKSNSVNCIAANVPFELLNEVKKFLPNRFYRIVYRGPRNARIFDRFLNTERKQHSAYCLKDKAKRFSVYVRNK